MTTRCETVFVCVCALGSFGLLWKAAAIAKIGDRTKSMAIRHTKDETCSQMCILGERREWSNRFNKGNCGQLNEERTASICGSKFTQ